MRCITMLAVAVAGLSVAIPVSAQQVGFFDDFKKGLDPDIWKVQHIYFLSPSATPLYSIDTSFEDVRLKALAGTGSSYHAVRIFFRPQVIGNFDMKVDFRDADIEIHNGWGQCANQIALHARFGSGDFATTRDIAAVEGNNYHVYTNPPGQTYGVTQTTDLAGTLEIKRTGSTYAGYYSGLKIYENTFSNPTLQDLWFSLENNQTQDLIGVTFDNFSIQADNIVYVPEPAALLSTFGAGFVLIMRRRTAATRSTRERHSYAAPRPT